MALISVSNLTFAHVGGPVIFNNVSLQLDTRWKLGLIGRNGRGKTTFLKLLLGQFEHGGAIRCPLKMDYFPFTPADAGISGLPEPAMIPGRELARRLCASRDSELEDWRLEREVSLLDLSVDALDRPYNTLSGGEAAKLLLASMFLRGNNFLLIDEPTNHLDLAGRQAVSRYLGGKEGFILVSHDRVLLDGCVDHVLSINRGGIELQRGNFSSWQENMNRREQYERAEHDRLKSEIARLEESAGRSANWSGRAEKGKFGQGPVDRGFIGHKAAKMMRRAKSAETRRRKAVEEKSGLLRNLENQEALSMRPLDFHSKRLAEFGGVAVNYGHGPVVGNISLSLMSGERIGICGGNGSGKSSLLKLLAGEGVPFEGSLYLPPQLRVAYVPQDTSFLRGSLKDFALERGLDGNLLRAVLSRLGFERGQFDADLAGFSAGQKKKYLLAAGICQEAHLYVWDEPLNHIDVISRMQIEDLLLECKPSMVFVEHDQAFLRRVATRIVELTPGGAQELDAW